MNTLIVYYSKSGNTKAFADKVMASLSCDMDEIIYDDKAQTIKTQLNPKDYDLVILMCPIWAFNLAEPMKLYLNQHKSDIDKYKLAVTCGGLGLRGCVSYCKKVLLKEPIKAIKIRAKHIKNGTFETYEIIK